MIEESLINAASFKPISVQFPNPWVGHIPFGAWIIKEVKPNIFVELGTHTGNSYFTFCQAVLESNLQTLCYAVDTWKGDGHSGNYTDEIFINVNAHNQKHYSEFSSLLRMTFDDASNYFSNESIGLLHIDGLHLYEAVYHDFKTWLPKLEAGAIVLFHDTIVRENNFGVWKLWKELKEVYHNNFEFYHSYGLGVLQLNNSPDEKKLKWLEKGYNKKLKIRTYFASLGTQQLERFELSQMKQENVNIKKKLAEQDIKIYNLNKLISDRDAEIEKRTNEISILDSQILELKKITGDLENQINKSSAFKEEAEIRISELNNQILNFGKIVNQRDKDLDSIFSSTSWIITKPLRALKNSYLYTTIKLKLFISVAKIGIRNWGLFTVINKSISIILSEGFAGLKQRILFVYQHINSPGITPIFSESRNLIEQLKPIQSIPYYLNPFICSDLIKIKYSRIAIHLHLYHLDLYSKIICYLRNISFKFDLFVSVPESANTELIYSNLKNDLITIGNLTVKMVPNRGRDLAPLIVEFGARLLKYEIICHIHSKRSSHNEKLSGWFEHIFERLFGAVNSGDASILQILQLFERDAKFIYPEDNLYFSVEYSNGWGKNWKIAKKILDSYSKYTIENYPNINFPQGSMFWAKSECIKDFLLLPISYEDFPKEPISDDGTLAHALERLIMIFSENYPGKFYRIHIGDSIHNYCDYENQIEFTNKINDDSVKVLSYYLPQFHPIPENDKWHGNGFTEWTKVRSANPLFVGHYQQHIPHKDIGYYIINSPEILRKQFQIMKASGVFGQVFYHYWFKGKLILEKPAKMLLDNKDILMPFCFCWANENWTMRWDGNENEVLLKQEYSASDAEEFIQYLIPFFKDKRYIRIDNRPVLFIYRPTAIPDPKIYLNIWNKICGEFKIPKPYVIATLTRGANHPNDFGMDAGVERVLHDWTNGNVKDVKGLLCLYQRINGSVIDYKDVSNFYKKQTGAKPFTYFRSIIPMWDNTPRYGGEAFLVHNSRPKFFQNWLEELINYSKKTLPQDRRFILINAWNEWAEGAHLEPDSRYGYAYLNSVGRALSGIPYQNFEYLNNSINPNLKIKIELSETFKINPNFNRELNRKFFICLSKSTLFQKCQVSVEDEIKNQLIFFNPDIPISIVDEKEYNYVFKFNRLCIFFFDSLEIMLKMALTFNNSVILSNSYGDNTEILPVEENFSVDSSFFGSIELRPANVYLNKKICVDARSYVISNNENKYFSETKLPAVTTIVRVHNGENFKMIKNALLCLLGMQGCVVQPLIAAQDLNELQKNELNEIINNYPWDISNKPILKFFESDSKNKDLRSKMLNESLKEVKNRYIAFLDYDDLLFSTAYEWLLKRLYVSNKAIAFGRVYVAQYDNHLQRILLREKTYEYGGTYREFLDINHAPIHSIMLDLSKLDISKIKYYDNQIYLEDYFLTLQLVKENNTDWEGLKQNYYLGDYIHNKDNSQTLAITSLEEKQKIINSKNYIKSEKRICKLKKSIKIRNGSL